MGTRWPQGLRVNHGAPHFDSVHSQRFRDILAQLHTGGYVAPFAGTCGVLHCGGAGEMIARSLLLTHDRWIVTASHLTLTLTQAA
jgi:hypothetical protein